MNDGIKALSRDLRALRTQHVATFPVRATCRTSANGSRSGFSRGVVQYFTRRRRLQAPNVRRRCRESTKPDSWP